MNLRRHCRQIYSLFPLTAREPHLIIQRPDVSPALGSTGARDRNRTRDRLITNQLLYQLSYSGPDGWHQASTHTGIVQGTDPYRTESASLNPIFRKSKEKFSTLSDPGRIPFTGRRFGPPGGDANPLLEDARPLTGRFRLCNRTTQTEVPKTLHPRRFAIWGRWGVVHLPTPPPKRLARTPSAERFPRPRAGRCKPLFLTANHLIKEERTPCHADENPVGQY